MSELYLVRHGQASFGSGDYDNLSELGERQSRWLGQYFAELGIRFDRAVVGTQRRHRQTIEAIFRGMAQDVEMGLHHGWDEYDFEAIRTAHERRNGVAPAALLQDQRRSYYVVLKQALHAWVDGSLDGELQETWNQFHDRVAEAVAISCNGQESGRRVLVVSSGGPIAMVIKQILELSPGKAIALNMQVKNTAFCQLVFSAKGIQLGSFNNVPHLERPGRPDAVTYS